MRKRSCFGRGAPRMDPSYLVAKPGWKKVRGVTWAGGFQIFEERKRRRKNRDGEEAVKANGQQQQQNGMFLSLPPP